MFCCLLLLQIDAKNILFLSGVPSASHHIWNKVLAGGLVDRGFNVTVLSAEIEYSTDRLHFVFMERIYERIVADFPDDYHIDDPKSVFRCIKDSYRFSHFVSTELLRTNGVKKLLSYPDNFEFDLIIHDFTMGQSLLGFWIKFGKPPLVSVSAFGAPFHTSTVANSPHFPGFMAHPLSRISSDHVVSDRVFNVLYKIYDTVYRKFTYMKQENNWAKHTFGKDLPFLEDIEQQSQLFLINTDPLLDSSLLLPPNIIPVGGLHVHREEVLNPNIAALLDASKNGVILFSLGATLKTDFMARDRDEIFFETFTNLKEYDFIWKYDKTEKFECPRNILMTDWTEQSVILQHPKVKLFITSGGILSVQEAIWNAVPILGIPLWPQQFHTVDKVVRKGFGKQMKLQALSQERLTKMITDIIGNPG